MAFAAIEYDRQKFIRCSRCGVLKQRTYKPNVTAAQKECIIACRKHTGFGYLKLARYLHMNHQTIQRVVRRFERYGAY